MPVIIPSDPETSQPYEELVLDSADVYASNTAVSLEDAAAGIRVISMKFPPPSAQTITAGSIDTEGDPLIHSRVGNRTVEIVVRCEGTNAVIDPHDQMRERITELAQKVGKLHGTRDPSDPSRTGTLKRTLTNGDVVYFDVLDAEIDVPADWDFIHNDSVEVTLTLECKPFAWGAEETGGSFTETTLPEAVFTVTGVKGDVPALGRLLVEDDSSNDQWFFHWGLQPPSQYPGTATASTTAALGYEAEALTPLNGAAGTAVVSRVTSGGTAVKLEVGASYAAILGTDIGGTAAMSHVGSYRVWARILVSQATSAGTVSVRLEWRPSAAGKYAANEPTVIGPDQNTDWHYRDLGLITIPRALTGAQQWDGRIVGKSTSGVGNVFIDRLMLVPVDGGYGEAAMVPPTTETPAEYVARDDFIAGTATIAGTVLSVGGTWSVVGSGGTFLLSDGLLFHAGTATGTMFALAGTAQHANIAVAAHHDPGRKSGMLARYKGTGDYLAYIAEGQTSTAIASTTYYEVILCSGGIAGTIASGYEPFGNTEAVYRQIHVDTSGRWSTYAGRSIDNISAQASGQDSRLATSGTLNTGQFGLIDAGGTATDYSRSWDNFRAWEPEYDAAIFAGRQAQIHHNRAEHQDSSGSAIARIADYQGDYLHIPPAGVEGGTSRFFVRPVRNLPATTNDPAIDDVSGTVYYTPRYWVIPE